MWELDYKESWVPKNWCFWTAVLEKTLESPLDCKEIQPVHPKGDQSWVFIGRTDVEAETPIFWPPDEKLTHLKRLWCWERLSAGREGDNRGWDGWMASPTPWRWVLVNSGTWWWRGRPGFWQSMGLQRAGHDWVTELNWTEGPFDKYTLVEWDSLGLPRQSLEKFVGCTTATMIPKPIVKKCDYLAGDLVWRSSKITWKEREAQLSPNAPGLWENVSWKPLLLTTQLTSKFHIIQVSALWDRKHVPARPWLNLRILGLWSFIKLLLF